MPLQLKLCSRIDIDISSDLYKSKFLHYEIFKMIEKAAFRIETDTETLLKDVEGY